MSMNLAELGRVICQDFDHRVLELNTIRSEIRTKLKNDWHELMQLADEDRVKLDVARRQVWEDTVDLMDRYREEMKTMLHGLKNDRAKQIKEMKAWDHKRREDLKGWYEAGAYLSRKRTGR